MENAIDTTRLLREHEVRTARHSGDPYCAAGCGRPEHCEVRPLAEEVADLRTRLAKAQAARDAAIRGSREIRGTLLETEFRLAAIEKLCEDGTTRDNWTAIRVLAAARGEGTDG